MAQSWMMFLGQEIDPVIRGSDFDDFFFNAVAVHADVHEVVEIVRGIGVQSAASAARCDIHGAVGFIAAVMVLVPVEYPDRTPFFHERRVDTVLGLPQTCRLP